jgi:hypothetical protein
VSEDLNTFWTTHLIRKPREGCNLARSHTLLPPTRQEIEPNAAVGHAVVCRGVGAVLAGSFRPAFLSLYLPWLDQRCRHVRASQSTGRPHPNTDHNTWRLPNKASAQLKVGFSATLFSTPAAPNLPVPAASTRIRITNYMERSPVWEAANCAATLELPSIS